MYKLNW